jgi:hypothetical protein
LEARTMAESGLAMACFEAMVAVCGRWWWWCRWRSGEMGGITIVVAVHFTQLSLSPPMHWSSPMQHSAGVEQRGCFRLSSPPPSFDFVLRRYSSLSCPVAPHSIP